MHSAHPSGRNFVLTAASIVRATHGAALLSVAVMVACGPRVEPASMVVRGGTIVTMDDAAPQVEALAARGDRIVAVGSRADIERYVGPRTQVIDLQGGFAMPGFIESHAHFRGIGDAKLQLNLTNATSWDEIVAMVAKAAASTPTGELIRGRGWHQSKWNRVPQPLVEGLPVHDALSAVSPDHPVVLVHASGHAAFVNAKALELAGITKATTNPPGGEIVRDRAGNPTGVLREAAEDLLSAPKNERGEPLLTPPPDSESLIRRQAELASEEILSKGITSFQDAGSSFDAIDIYKKLVDEGRLPLRLWVMVSSPNAELAQRLAQARIIGYGDHRLTVRAIKRVADGALGSHGAWLLAPYADLPTSTGLNTVPMEDLRETARLAAEHDVQLCVHAIGDRANREVLNVFERTFSAREDKKDWRWRIEHAQHLHPTDVPRFKTLGVIASMQGLHATSDAIFVPVRLGAARTAEGAYLWQTLLKQGTVVVNGTDAPVEDVDPISNFYASVTRKTKDGLVFTGDQAMTRDQALRSYTRDAAFAAFEDDIKGTLSVGKLADITVLDQNLLTVPDGEIEATKVIYTIVGGTIVYRR